MLFLVRANYFGPKKNRNKIRESEILISGCIIVALIFKGMSIIFLFELPNVSTHNSIFSHPWIILLAWNWILNVRLSIFQFDLKSWKISDSWLKSGGFLFWREVPRRCTLTAGLKGNGLVKLFDASRKVIVLKFQKPAQIKTLEEDELESCDFCLSDGLTRTTC